MPKLAKVTCYGKISECEGPATWTSHTGSGDCATMLKSYLGSVSFRGASSRDERKKSKVSVEASATVDGNQTYHVTADQKLLEDVTFF